MEDLYAIYQKLNRGEKALVWLALLALVTFVAAAASRAGGSQASTLLGAVIAGAFTLLGAWMSRWLRRTGAVRCRATAVNSLILPLGGDLVVPLEVERPGLPVSNEALEHVTHGIVYSLRVEFFNERDTNTGLRDLLVVFLDAKGATVQENSMLKSEEETPTTDSHNGSYVGPILLRSGEFVDLDLQTTLAADPDGGTIGIQRCRGAELRGRFPDGRELRQHIDFPRSFDGDGHLVG